MLHFGSFTADCRYRFACQIEAYVMDRQMVGQWKEPKMPFHYAKAELAERGTMNRFRKAKEEANDLAKQLSQRL